MEKAVTVPLSYPTRLERHKLPWRRPDLIPTKFMFSLEEHRSGDELILDTKNL